jgi:hypothetical protein
MKRIAVFLLLSLAFAVVAAPALARRHHKPHRKAHKVATIKLTNQRLVTVIYGISMRTNVCYRSTNAGMKWEMLGQLPDPSSGNYHTTSWATPMIGLAVSWDGVYRTADGGVSWALVHAGYFGDVALLPDGRAWAVGASALMDRSADFGLTWSAVTLSDVGTADIYTVDVAPGAGASIFGYCAGHTDSGSAVIMTSSDGVTWTRQTSGFNFDVMHLACGRSAANGGYAIAGCGGVTKNYYTSDSGATWAECAGTFAAFSSYQHAVLGTSGRLAGGGNGLSRSVDGGANFTAVTGFGYSSGVYGLTASSDTDVYAEKANGPFMVSRDGGATWRETGVAPEPLIYPQAVTGYLSTGSALTLEVDGT